MKKQPVREIVDIESLKGGGTQVINRIPVVANLMPGARMMCDRRQDTYDKVCKPARVYLMEDGVPIYAAYCVDNSKKNPQPMKRAS